MTQSGELTAATTVNADQMQNNHFVYVHLSAADVHPCAVDSMQLPHNRDILEGALDKLEYLCAVPRYVPIHVANPTMTCCFQYAA